MRGGKEASDRRTGQGLNISWRFGGQKHSMLVLTRRVGETLVIGEDIRITVLEIRGRQVRLGIEAPPGFPIKREEYQNPEEKQKGHGD